MRQDYDLGLKIASAKKEMPVEEFVARIEHIIEWNRFDWEGGETEMHIAFFTVLHGFTSAGGIVTFEKAMRVSDDE